MRLSWGTKTHYKFESPPSPEPSPEPYPVFTFYHCTPFSTSTFFLEPVHCRPFPRYASTETSPSSPRLAGKSVDTPQEALTIIDIVLRQLPGQRYVSVGRFLYSPDIKKLQQLGGGLESWRGFYQSIRPTQMGLSLNIANIVDGNLNILSDRIEELKRKETRSLTCSSTSTTTATQ
ncbi:hypothetical protein F2P56_034778 [Juglans regia]|uniref:Protein argonaute 5-like n=2 Tax=Juglans regia TaxID=51240 RepID=A0A2I4FN86_JUGRE|nr:protein argonaute 5-like [Juglans regia]KAF5445751.1 hypothetical protein F2P56_034778 [Juglans regia]